MKFNQMTIDFYLHYLPRSIALVENEPTYPRKAVVLERLKKDLQFWQNIEADQEIDPGNYCSPPEEMEIDDDNIPF